ncbi:MAG TPA: class I SAM-dependent methyltransferase, partial [Roseiflexaceae bacterium]|nr:class I SAM-dependent methyltransferase [Roseiflexaceae bacterium]
VAALGPFDWIVIDAGHYAHEVQADWERYAPMAAPGGVIALHDILPAAVDWIQVDQVWATIQAEGYVTQELIASRTVDWGGWGLVYR